MTYSSVGVHSHGWYILLTYCPVSICNESLTYYTCVNIEHMPHSCWSPFANVLFSMCHWFERYVALTTMYLSLVGPCVPMWHTHQLLVSNYLIDDTFVLAHVDCGDESHRATYALLVRSSCVLSTVTLSWTKLSPVCEWCDFGNHL